MWSTILAVLIGNFIFALIIAVGRILQDGDK